MWMAEIIADFEGMKENGKVYTDTRSGIKTVGVGFNTEQPNARAIVQTNLPDVAFDDVLSRKTSLTKPQANQLFQETLKDKVQTTQRLFPKRLFPNYENYPNVVKTAPVNGMFRGEFKSTQEIVNIGEWDKVADEYLDWADYRASKPGKDGGIRKRELG